MSLRQTIKYILLELGKHLHIDTIFYARILGWVGVNYSTSVLRGITTTFLLARWLPAETFGAFRYVIAIYGLASIFSFSSYNSGVIRGVAANDTETAWAAGKQMIKYSFIGSSVIIGAGIERLWNGEATIATCIFVSSLFFPFASASSLYGSVLTGSRKIDTLSKHHSMNNILFILVFLLSLYLGRKNLVVITLAFFGVDVILKSLLTLYHLSKLERRGSAAKHLELGSQLSAMGIAQAFAHQIDQFIIQRFFGYTALANYNIAILIPEQIIDFIKGFSGILLQRKTEEPLNERASIQSTRKQMMYFFYCTALLVGVYALAAPPFIKLFFPKYTSQIIPTIVYAFGIIGTASSIGFAWMQARHRIKDLWRFSLVNGTLQIVLTTMLTPLFGSMGAIFAKTVTRIINIPFCIPIKEARKITT